MTALIDESQQQDVQYFKLMFSRYERSRDLIAVGAYAPGSDPTLDTAIALQPAMAAFLQQGIREYSDPPDGRARLAALVHGNETSS